MPGVRGGESILDSENKCKGTRTCVKARDAWTLADRSHPEPPFFILGERRALGVAEGRAVDGTLRTCNQKIQMDPLGHTALLHTEP